MGFLQVLFKNSPKSQEKTVKISMEMSVDDAWQKMKEKNFHYHIEREVASQVNDHIRSVVYEALDRETVKGLVQKMMSEMDLPKLIREDYEERIRELLRRN